MTISNKGLDLIKESESFRAIPYLCPAGIPTIGYGTTIYENGKAVKLTDDSITEKQAESILRFQVNNLYGKAVNRYVQVDINQNQFDALSSFVYNVGAGNLQRSTLLKKLNNSDYEGAAQEFTKWNKSNGRILKGLTIRREKERDLFLL